MSLTLSERVVEMVRQHPGQLQSPTIIKRIIAEDHGMRPEDVRTDTDRVQWDNVATIVRNLLITRRVRSNAEFRLTLQNECEVIDFGAPVR